MSTPSPLSNESIAPSTPDAERAHDDSQRRFIQSVKRPAQFVCFWTAVVLPFVHVPLLSQGLDSASVAATFVVLLALNVLALYAGHGYNQD